MLTDTNKDNRWECIGKNSRLTAVASMSSPVVSLDALNALWFVELQRSRPLEDYRLCLDVGPWFCLVRRYSQCFTRNNVYVCVQGWFLLRWCNKPAAYSFMRMHVRLGYSNTAAFADPIRLEGPNYVCSFACGLSGLYFSFGAWMIMTIY